MLLKIGKHFYSYRKNSKEKCRIFGIHDLSQEEIAIRTIDICKSDDPILDLSNIASALESIAETLQLNISVNLDLSKDCELFESIIKGRGLTMDNPSGKPCYRYKEARRFAGICYGEAFLKEKEMDGLFE